MELGALFDLGQDASIWDSLLVLSVLPAWLLAARNPDSLREVLSLAIPQFARGQLLLQKCAVDHIRYKDDHWSGFYHLITALPGEQKPLTMDLEGEIFPPGTSLVDQPQAGGDLGTDGWQATIPSLNLSLRRKEAEKVLASLAFLTGPEESRQYLTSAIRSASDRYQAMEIQASHPKVVRYKPGSRCTIVYQLDYAGNPPPGSRWPRQMVAKTYKGVKGKNAFDSMAALWNSPLGASSTLNIAEPLAYDEKQRVLIQAAIPEEKTLKNLLHDAIQSRAPEALAELRGVLQKTAAGLAELHQCGVAPDQDWDWKDELAEIQERVDSLSAAYPALAQAAEPLLSRVRQLADAVPPDPGVPSHGSFRPSQVLIHQGQVGFIDFDSFTLSEPANDLALFLSTLMINALNDNDDDDEQEEAAAAGAGAGREDATSADLREQRLALAASLHEQFLAAYEQHHTVSRQRVALWETLDLLLLVLHYWIKVKPAELKEIIFLLERFLPLSHIVGARPA